MTLPRKSPPLVSTWSFIFENLPLWLILSCQNFPKLYCTAYHIRFFKKNPFSHHIRFKYAIIRWQSLWNLLEFSVIGWSCRMRSFWDGMWVSNMFIISTKAAISFLNFGTNWKNESRNISENHLIFGFKYRSKYDLNETKLESYQINSDSGLCIQFDYSVIFSLSV